MTGLNDFRNHPCNEPFGPRLEYCTLKRGHDGEHRCILSAEGQERAEWLRRYMTPVTQRSFVGAVEYAIDGMFAQFNETNGVADLRRLREWLVRYPAAASVENDPAESRSAPPSSFPALSPEERAAFDFAIYDLEYTIGDGEATDLWRQQAAGHIETLKALRSRLSSVQGQTGERDAICAKLDIDPRSDLDAVLTEIDLLQTASRSFSRVNALRQDGLREIFNLRDQLRSRLPSPETAGDVDDLIERYTRAVEDSWETGESEADRRRLLIRGELREALLRADVKPFTDLQRVGFETIRQASNIRAARTTPQDSAPAGEPTTDENSLNPPRCGSPLAGSSEQKDDARGVNRAKFSPLDVEATGSRRESPQPACGVTSAVPSVVPSAGERVGASARASSPVEEPTRVHNHGTEDGPGLACRETVINGRLVGECLRVAAPPLQESDEL